MTGRTLHIQLRIAFQGASLELAENQNKIQEELATLRQNMNNSTDNTVSLIQRLDENQQTVNADIDSLSISQVLYVGWERK